MTYGSLKNGLNCCCLSLLLWSPCECYSCTTPASISHPGTAVAPLSGCPNRTSQPVPCRAASLQEAGQHLCFPTGKSAKYFCSSISLCCRGPCCWSPNWVLIPVTAGDIPLKSQWPCHPGEHGPSLLQAATLQGSPTATAVALQQSLAVSRGGSRCWRWKGLAAEEQFCSPVAVPCGGALLACVGGLPRVPTACWPPWLRQWLLWLHLLRSCLSCHHGALAISPACEVPTVTFGNYLPPQVPHSGIEFRIFPLFLYF